MAAAWSLRKFVWTDDTTQDSEERLQQPSLQVKVAITREQSFSLQFHESKPRECGYNYCYPPTINKSRIEACRSTM